MTLQTERACAPLCLFPAVAIGAKTALTPSPGTFCTASPDQAVEDDIIEATRPRWINGLSLLGGEPFEPENQAPLLAFLRRFRAALPDKTVWCYTGFTLEELLGKSGECRACIPHTRELLGLIDILVDGRYEEELADITLAFRGSKNQRVLDLPATLTTGEPVLYLE